MSLSRDQILASKHDRKPVRVEVPEWGGAVFVRLLSSRESLDLTEGRNQTDLVYELLLMTLVDEEGKAVFTMEDRAFLEDEPFKLVLDIFTQAGRINGLPVGNVEQAMEDFAPAPDASSSTG